MIFEDTIKRLRETIDIRFYSGAGHKTPEIFVQASSNKKWCHIRFKLRFAARFTKRENGVSITHDFPLFVKHQFRFILYWGWKDVADQYFDILSKNVGKRETFIIVLKQNNGAPSVIVGRILHICKTGVVPTFGSCCSWFSDNNKCNSL